MNLNEFSWVFQALAKGLAVQVYCTEYEEWQDANAQEVLDCILYGNIKRQHIRVKPRWEEIALLPGRIPKPLDKVNEEGEIVWLAAPDYVECAYLVEWQSRSSILGAMLERGLLHATKEAAQAHARELIVIGGGIDRGDLS